MAECPCERAHGLDVWVRSQVRRQPDAIAISHGEQSLSYREFGDLVNTITRDLSKSDVQREEPICVFTPMGIPHIVAQLANHQAGGAMRTHGYRIGR